MAIDNPEYSRFLVIGHRGLPKLAPENSGSAFKLAVQLCIPMIELDVRLTRDKELVVIHDNEIRKISDGKGKVSRNDLRFLRQFDFGSHFHFRFKGEKLLTLDEALDILLPSVAVMIELKEDKKRRREMSEVLFRTLAKRTEMLPKLVICSFSDKLLLEVQSRIPDARLGLIFRTKPKSKFHKALECGFSSVHPHHQIAKKKFLRWAKSNGLAVYIWTVNTMKSIKKWKSAGVQGVITDIPERIMNSL
ncbi:MAG: hypothetical protein HZC17_03920 [Candidatus Omnitrophica bacterium]|nr:hypothetical protein [Candidatus Omnitrophota bacterium]